MIPSLPQRRSFPAVGSLAVLVSLIPALAGPAPPAGLSTKVNFKDSTGAEVFAIKPEPDGAKLVDRASVEIARYKLDGDKLKIKDKDEKVLGYIVGSGSRYHLKDAGQKVVLFELQRQDDGDWKLQDGKETLIYKIKKRDYGYEIEDAP